MEKGPEVRTREGLTCPASWSEILFSGLWMGQVPNADSFPWRSHCWNSSQLWASGNLPPLLQSIAYRQFSWLPVLGQCPVRDKGPVPTAISGRTVPSYVFLFYHCGEQFRAQPFVFHFLRKELGTIFWAFKSPETTGQVLSSSHPLRC